MQSLPVNFQGFATICKFASTKKRKVEKAKKIDKEFCLTDDSVNVYGYRCLTSGLLLEEVKRNPIGFKMHNRDNGIVVRWEDFRLEGDKLMAKPVINLSHPEGEQTVSEIENGFLNAASVGRIVVLEATNAPELQLEGQTQPTVTKWFPREISLVDIPGNYNALANLFDENDNALNLADFTNNLEPMSKTVLNAAQILTALNLSDSAAEADVLNALTNLIDTAAKVPQLEKDLSDKTTELNSLKSATQKKEVEDLIAKGKADKKLTVELANTLLADYEANPSGLKNLIDALPAQMSLMDNLDPGAVPEKFAGKSWDDLYASNELETVRTKYPDLFESLRKEKFKTN
ncbi:MULTISPECIES: phage protease [Flavobacterium]|uniref:phage protease n=1 Tax=Flavobacterium TaxID=237 RepID=UPI000B4D5056|nr:MULTISPECIES: phage protease [Flavobacterium]OWP87510.1 hypothetical protein BWK60_03310 [Flavobacterium covae]